MQEFQYVLNCPRIQNRDIISLAFLAFASEFYMGENVVFAKVLQEGKTVKVKVFTLHVKDKGKHKAELIH